MATTAATVATAAPQGHQRTVPPQGHQGIAVVTRKGQVTIPKPIRDQMGVQVGDRVSFVVREGEVVLKIVRGSILDIQGSVQPRHRPEDFDRIRRSARRSRAARAANSE